MKTCSRCGLSKPFEEFNKNNKSKDGRHTYCRPCHKAHYQENRIRHCKNVKQTRDKYKRQIQEILRVHLSGGCVDCGNLDLRVLDFDHVRGEKIGNVATMARNQVRIPTILQEIEKCEVRCKNCHAIKTYERIGGSWRDPAPMD